MEERRKTSSPAEPIPKTQNHVPYTRRAQETPEPSQHAATNLTTLLVARHESLDSEICRELRAMPRQRTNRQNDNSDRFITVKSSTSPETTRRHSQRVE